MVWSSLSDGAILQTACSASKVNTGQLSSSILDAEHLSRERVMAQARYLNLAPLTMTDEQMEKGLEIFEASLKEALEA